MEAKRPVLWRWTADGMIQDAQGNWISTVDHPEASAAPQLLEALRKMRKRFDPIDLGVDDEEACDLADAAIRAAEGGGV